MHGTYFRLSRYSASSLRIFSDLFVFTYWPTSIKKLLSREETMHPNFYDSIKRSLIPLMHDDLTPILRGYTEEVVSKRRTHRKNPVQDVSAECDVAQSHLPLQNGNGSKKHGLPEKSTVSDAVASLQEFSEEELVIELARRKAKKAREMKSSCNENDLSYIPDPTGQVCSLNGGNGSIPCSELME